ncbi:hypothetical protein SASPL_127105 [Salvia splendens]|uniref:Mitochondrial protein n=1 Tax=Salvia splendens TaxID=180675 RepID=A0A8X8XIV3_SALSN|nr:hypothetical protein SASPL_127105 [Salvia splendens]
MESCNPVNTPVAIGQELRTHDGQAEVDPTYLKSLVGSLRYLTCIRPDILYGVGLINRYMETPSQSHLNAAKRILPYIKDEDVEEEMLASSRQENGSRYQGRYVVAQTRNKKENNLYFRRCPSEFVKFTKLGVELTRPIQLGIREICRQSSPSRSGSKNMVWRMPLDQGQQGQADQAGTEGEKGQKSGGLIKGVIKQLAGGPLRSRKKTREADALDVDHQSVIKDDILEGDTC